MSDIDMRKGYDPVVIVIHDRKKNITLKETSLVAIDKENHKVLATGNDAVSFVRQGDSNVFVLSPLKHGVVADYTVAQVMFQNMLRKASVLNKILKPKIALGIPKDITEVEQKAFIDVFYQSGARNVLLFDEEIFDEVNLSLPPSYGVLVRIVQKEKREQTRQETWKEVWENKIPIGAYQFVSIKKDELKTVITLSSSTDCIQIEFQKVMAIRMLEKKVIPDNLYSDNEIEKFRKDQFKNRIYQIENGEFGDFIKENENIRGKVWSMNCNHYIIMSENDGIEVLSEQEPNIVTWKLKSDQLIE